MQRRSFFKQLAQAAAIVALAPQIAFRARLPAVAFEEPEPLIAESFWFQVQRGSDCYSEEYLNALKTMQPNIIPIIYKRPSKTS